MILVLSVSSLFITLITVSILIFLFHFLITGKKSHALFRADFLTIILIAILMRIVFPVELFFTVTIPSTNLMTALHDALLFEILPPLTFMHILFIIWISGSVIMGVRYLLKMKRLHALSVYMQRNAAHHAISEYIQSDKNYDLYISEVVSAPMVIGLRGAIYLPKADYSERELQYILSHEKQHLQNKDIWIKQFINVLIILYWWFPPLYILRKQIDLYLEMRTDSAVIKNMNKADYLEYIQTILDMQQKQAEAKPFYPNLSLCFIDDNEVSLRYRVDFLLKGTPQSKTNRLFLMIAIMVPFLSNLIILEPSYINSPDLESVYTFEEFQESSYIIEHHDGTYTLVFDGEEIPLESLDIPDFQGIKVVKEQDISK